MPEETDTGPRYDAAPSAMGVTELSATTGFSSVPVAWLQRRGVALCRLVDMLAFRRPAAGPAGCGWARPSGPTMYVMAGTEVLRPGGEGLR